MAAWRSEPVIDRRFKKSPLIFDIASWQTSLGGLACNRCFKIYRWRARCPLYSVQLNLSTEPPFAAKLAQEYDRSLAAHHRSSSPQKLPHYLPLVLDDSHR